MKAAVYRVIKDTRPHALLASSPWCPKAWRLLPTFSHSCLGEATPCPRTLLLPGAEEHNSSQASLAQTISPYLLRPPPPHGCTPALRSPAKGPALSFSRTPTETMRRAVSADEEEKHMESAPWRWTTVQQTALPYAPSRVLPRGGETAAMVL